MNIRDGAFRPLQNLHFKFVNAVGDTIVKKLKKIFKNPLTNRLLSAIILAYPKTAGSGKSMCFPAEVRII